MAVLGLDSIGRSVGDAVRAGLDEIARACSKATEELGALGGALGEFRARLGALQAGAPAGAGGGDTLVPGNRVGPVAHLRASATSADQNPTSAAVSTGGGGGGQSESNQFKTALEEEVAAERAAGIDTKRYEWARWNERLTAVKEGSKEYQEALREVNRLSREIRNEEVRDAEDAAKKLQAVEAAKTERAEQAAKSRYDLEKATIQKKEAQGILSEQQSLELLRQAEEREYQAELAAAQKKMDLYKQDTKEYQQALKEKEKIQQQHDLRLVQEDTKTITSMQSKWKSMAQSISSSMTNAITGMLTGTQSMANSLKNIWNQIASTIINKILTISLQYLLGEQTRTAATTAGTVARDGIQDAGYATGLAKQAATGGKAVMNDAYQAYSGAYASASQIPYVGWILGPIAGAAAFAAVAAMSVLSSAAGGWGEVPSDQLAMVHKREMVLPARIAETVRAMSDPAAIMRDAFSSAMAPALSASGSSSAGSAVNPLKGALTAALAPALSLASTGPRAALAGVGSWGIPGDKLQFLSSVSRGEAGKSIASHSSSVSNASSSKGGTNTVNLNITSMDSQDMYRAMTTHGTAVNKALTQLARHGHLDSLTKGKK